MCLSQLFESTIKHASFCFGRMNPPTLGHGQLIDTVAQASQGGDYFVFASGTQDKKKNPLDYTTKIKFLRALFPKQASHVVNDPTLKTIMQVAEWLYAQGFRSVTFVAGSDRLDSFKQLLTSYNGVEGNDVYYKFDAINFVSSGERDPDADGIAGISASGAREAAVNGDITAFAQATGAGKLTQSLYDAVRKGMLLENNAHNTSYNKIPLQGRTFGIRGFKIEFTKDGLYISRGGQVIYNKTGDYSNPTQRNLTTVQKLITGLEDKMSQDPTSPFSPLFGKRNPEYLEKRKNWYKARDIWWQTGEWPTNISPEELEVEPKDLEVTECSGYIPKNKKEANDPRWSNSLTVDIKPGAINKNLKALRLI